VKEEASAVAYFGLDTALERHTDNDARHCGERKYGPIG